MKESVGYTVTLNIVITFIVIVFTFLSSTLIYFKSNKVSNVIMNSIEKYEGYNAPALEDINSNLSNIGYNVSKINCSGSVSTGGVTCALQNVESNNSGEQGYCVYFCDAGDGYYFYRVRVNMPINIPIINGLIKFPIFSNTNRLYDFTIEQVE